MANRRLQSAADDLDSQYTRVKVAHLIGNSLSAVGSVGSIAACFAIPFSGGVTLIPAVLGPAVGMAGTLISYGATFYQGFSEKHALKILMDITEVGIEGTIFCTHFKTMSEMLQATKETADTTVTSANKTAKLLEEVASKAAANVSSTSSTPVAALGDMVPAAAQPAVESAERAMESARLATQLTAESTTTAVIKTITDGSAVTKSAAGTALKNLTDAASGSAAGGMPDVAREALEMGHGALANGERAVQIMSDSCESLDAMGNMVSMEKPMSAFSFQEVADSFRELADIIDDVADVGHPVLASTESATALGGNMAKATTNPAEVAQLAAQKANTTARIAVDAAKTSERASKLVKALKSPVVWWNLMSLFYNVYHIVKTIFELKNGTKSPISPVLRRLADRVDELVQKNERPR